MTIRANQKVYFILSVDTEEEWDWADADAFPEKAYGLENIQALLPFQNLCQSIGVCPTYFVDYAVLKSDQCAQVIRQISETKHAEIGAHLHPWNNPPFFGPTGERESHVINLPADNVRAKLRELVNIIEEKLEITPNSFRTGRWGINAEVLGLLREFGFGVDASIIPFYETEFFSCNNSPLQPYYPSWTDLDEASSQRELLEMPVTSGFNRTDFQRSAAIHRAISNPAIRPFKLVAGAWHTGLLRKMFLSPELTTLEDMKSLCLSSLKNDHKVLHMFIHSSSLIDNPNSQIANVNAYKQLTESISELVGWLGQQCDLEFCTVSEYAKKLKSGEITA